jgi:hypothetical protein
MSLLIFEFTLFADMSLHFFAGISSQNTWGKFAWPLESWRSQMLSRPPAACLYREAAHDLRLRWPATTTLAA